MSKWSARIMSGWLSKRDLLVLVAGTGASAAVVALLRPLPGINPTTVALLLLLAVFGTATLGRLRVAIVVSLIATLTLNFFFIPPIHTFTVAEAQNWIALVVFLVVAITSSNLSAAAQERAREAQKADLAATLLASLSHDLRTPLTAIKVALDNLSGPLPDEERLTQSAAALSEIDRLTRLFEAVLDMARIDSAAIRIERQWVTAADIVDAAMAYAQPALDQYALRVDADEGAEVELDPRLVSLAVAHVLENSARYSSPGSPIDVRAFLDHRGLRLSVTDAGPGIDPEDLKHIFERFYRGRAARQKTIGTGMGLSIARGLLAAVGGTVSAENTVEAGARFSISVPGPVRPVPGPRAEPASAAMVE
jgi:two-component system sensor histidine kinase KdpD